MNRTPQFKWKLLALGLALALAATFTACRNPTSPDNTGSGHINPNNPDGTNPDNPDGMHPSNPDGTNPNNPDGTDPNNPDPDNPDGTDPGNPDPDNPDGTTTYTVKFFDGDIEYEELRTIVKENDPVGKPDDPLAGDDYTFIAWYKEAQVFTNEWDFTSGVTADINLFARFSPNSEKVKVTFYLKGGSYNGDQALLNQEFVKGLLAKEPSPEPEKRLASFLGWFVKEGEIETETEWGFSDSAYRVWNDLDLYAKWIDPYNVHFVPNGGTLAVGTESLQEVNHNKPVSEPSEPTRNKHRFLGWFSSAEAAVKWNFDDPVTGDMTLTARWMLQHEITFNSDGGLFTNGNPGTVKVDTGTLLTTEPEVSRNKHNFKGWRKDGASSDWNFEKDLVTEDMTLSARWVIQHEVTFNADGGVFTNGNPGSVNVEAGTLLTTKPDVSRAKHKFTGWRKDGTSSDWNFEKDLVTEDMTLTAQWVALHTVTFNSNGGAPAMKEVYVPDGEPVGKPDPADFGKDGAVPLSWHTVQNEAEQEDSNKWDFSTLVTGDMPLYAQWPARYTVTFITGKVGAGATVLVDVWENQPIGSTNPNAPKKGDGKIGAEAKFLHWVDEANPGTTWDLDTMPITKDDIRLRPEWEAFTVGEEGPSGGMIFHYEEKGFTLYLDADDTEGVTAHYLEVGPSLGLFRWQASGGTNIPMVQGNEDSSTGGGIDAALYSRMGYGRRNTAIILRALGTENAPAAEAAFDYGEDGTWFLPSEVEFRKLASSTYSNFGLDNVLHWTSNQTNATQAAAVNFNGSTANVQPYTGKGTEHIVRPIRAW